MSQNNIIIPHERYEHFHDMMTEYLEMMEAAGSMVSLDPSSSTSASQGSRDSQGSQKTTKKTKTLDERFDESVRIYDGLCRLPDVQADEGAVRVIEDGFREFVVNGAPKTLVLLDGKYEVRLLPERNKRSGILVGDGDAKRP